MKNMVSRIGLSFLLLTIFFASGAAPARAEAITVIENTVMSPVVFSMLVPCAAGGAGELVDFTGSFHSIYSLTRSSDGTVRYKLSTQAQNVVGVGPVTGDSYVFSGGYTEIGVFSLSKIYTTLYDFRVIGQGAGNNYIAHTVTHYTFNANGELVVDFVVTGATCM